LADVKRMVMQAEPFEVRDAKTGQDLTRSILLQIILEEETKGMPIFSTQMLAQLIRFYGHAMQGMMGAHLEKNLQTFVELQTRFAQPAKGLYDPSAFTPETWAERAQGQSPTMMQKLA
jgi:polyhydroxyalkanoate synthesis repressor PhaR